MVRALVSAEAVNDVVRSHANRANDAARRLGCSPGGAAEATRLAADELIADLQHRPETVRDLVGAFLARVRTHAEALRLSTTFGTTGQAPAHDAPAAVLQSAAQSAAVERALNQLSDDERFALLVRDSYDLTVHQAAVALRLDAPESARAIALARLSLIAALEGTEPLSLAGHDVALGDLGQLADGSAPPGGRFAALRRHVSGCAQCAAILDAESRAAAMMSALPVLALDDAQRETIFGGAARTAVIALPTESAIRREFDEGPAAARPIVEPLIAAGALLIAALLGVGLGALLASHPSTPAPADASTSAGPSATTDTATTAGVTPSATDAPSGFTSTIVAPITTGPAPTSSPPTSTTPSTSVKTSTTTTSTPSSSTTSTGASTASP